MYPTVMAAAAAERRRDLRESARRSHEAARARRQARSRRDRCPD
jgi:hypothetical protein